MFVYAENIFWTQWWTQTEILFGNSERKTYLMIEIINGMLNVNFFFHPYIPVQ